MTDFFSARGTDNRPAEQPSLIDTGKGFSVSYLGRLLYSRYDPSRSSLAAIKTTSIQNETLVICPSPVLGYALSELLDILPKDCLVLAIECDENLMAFSAAHIPEQVLKHPRLKYIRTSVPAKVVEYIDGLRMQPFRRCLRLDLSAGAALNGQFYDDAVRLVDGYIQQCWRNHVTLMKLGRNYARNFFRNLPSIAASPPPEALFAAAREKALFVAGAGPSLDGTIPFMKNHRDELFILAVDTALRALADAEIIPDAVVLVESQFWIERAFIGFRASRVPILADLTARPGAIASLGGTRAFFLSEYAHLKYLGRFLADCDFLPVIQPLGSVGLAALEIAQNIARGEPPIFFTGLDFSWGRGLTHSRGAPTANDERTQATRLSPTASRVPALSPGITMARGKGNDEVFTDPALSGYAALCAATFAQPSFAPEQGSARSSSPFLDMGTTGLDMGFPRVTAAEAETILADRKKNRPVHTQGTGSGEKDKASTEIAVKENAISTFLESEKIKLESVRSVLTGERAIENAQEFLAGEIGGMDYLFAHFPDGYRGYSDNPAFLKRVRIELEYFLKTINTALAELD